jgi:hypothetical protein
MSNKVLWFLIGAVIGVALGLYLRAKDVIQLPRMSGRVHRLGDGDPPVLISDGSFFTQSDNDFASVTSTTLVPNGSNTATGALKSNCDDMTGLGLVEYFDGKTYWDASPLPGQALDMTIKHHGKPITVTTNPDFSNLTIYDKNNGDGWYPPSGFFTHKAQDKDPTHIEDVTYVDPANGSKIPKKAVGDNAYVAFCYK